MSPEQTEDGEITDTKREIRPLTAPEWHGLLSETNYTLRISDGTKQGSWYFWCEKNHEEGEDWLHARCFIWHDDRQVGTNKLEEALEGDVTTQLIVRTRDLEDDDELMTDGGTVEDASPRPDGWFESLGKPVSYERRAIAAKKAREMGLSLDGEEEVEYIGSIAKAIADDRPNEAIAKARERLDLTGTYRLLAYLCVGSSEESEEDSEPDDAGLYAKYDVRKDGEPVDDCFVLEPKSDPAARVALSAYAGHTDDEDLRQDLNEWLADLWRSDVDGGDSA